jgi:DNA repair exonuclease SbcCD nuclease subunit
MSKETLNICAAHLFARNGVTCESERIFIGSSGDVDSRHFDCFHYTALGHPAPRPPDRHRTRALFRIPPQVFLFRERRHEGAPFRDCG